jgi:hypothetical protein
MISISAISYKYYREVPADLNDSLAQSIAATVDVWYKSIDALNQQLFDGSDESILLLDKLFEDGKLTQNA